MLKHTNSTRKQLPAIIVRLVNSVDEFLLRQTEKVLGRVPEVGYNVGLLVIYILVSEHSKGERCVSVHKRINAGGCSRCWRFNSLWFVVWTLKVARV